MKYIESPKNPQIKQWKKLLTKKERDKTGTFLAEGFHLVEEAVKAKRIAHLIVQEGTDIPRHWLDGSFPATMVAKEVMNQLCDTETPQGVIAVCCQEQLSGSLEGETFLLVDAVQDPGNLGTLIRTADAAGLDGVITGHGTVDIYNPKVLRSAQGSHFHLSIVRGDLNQWIPTLQNRGIPVYGTSLENGKVYKEIMTGSSFALLVGNEGNGVQPELLKMTDENLYIPIFGKSESLNVAVAAGILLYYLKG